MDGPKVGLSGDWIMRLIFLAAIAFIALVSAAHADIYTTRPSQWTEKQDKQWVEKMNSDSLSVMLRFCQNYRSGRAGRHALTKDDFAEYEFVFNLFKIPKKDFKYIRAERPYHSGQSYAGLICALGYVPKLNESFYESVGYQWQLVLRNNRFVYLEGNGDSHNMKVTGWN